MATCAACLRPILGRDKFLLAGTEVFHRECVRNVETSIGNRNKLEIVKLRGEVCVLRQQDRAIHELERKLSNAQRTLGARDRELSRAERDRRDLEAERDAMQRERDNALREVLLLRTMSGALTTATPTAPATAVPPEKPASTPESAETDLDDAEQRFRLLELDPLA